MGITLYKNIVNGEQNFHKQSLQHLRENINSLVHLADSTIQIDSQILEDSITHLSTNSLVENALVINPNGDILFANNFAWRDEAVSQYLPNLNLQNFNRVKKTRKAIIEYIKEKQTYVAMMSFSFPDEKATLRNLSKGVIYLSYDISEALSNLRYRVIVQNTPEMILMLILVLLLMAALQYFLIKPLNAITLATKDIAKGNFNVKVEHSGVIEIQQLAATFNKMNKRISSYIFEIDKRADHIQGILDNTFDGIITINQFGVVVSINSKVEKIFKIRANDILGENIKSLMPEKYEVNHDQYLDNYVTTGNAQIIGIGREVQGQRSDGSVFPMDLAVTEIESDTKERMFVGIVRDITERKEKEKEVEDAREKLIKANSQLEELIRTDGLTGINNRRSFDEMIVTELNRAIRQIDDIALLIFDVDFFKKYNDHYGHVEGDQCLIQVAQAAKEQFQRSGELVARYGGEEFAVIMPHTNIDIAYMAANKLLKKVAELKIEHVDSTVSKYVSISIGVVSIKPHLNHTVKDLIEAADSALYDAKEKGRDQVVIFQK